MGGRTGQFSRSVEKRWEDGICLIENDYMRERVEVGTEDGSTRLQLMRWTHDPLRQ